MMGWAMWGVVATVVAGLYVYIKSKRGDSE